MTFTAKNTSTGFQGYGPTITQNHTIAAGSNRVLVAGYGSGDTDNIASVTFNGTALTRVRADFGTGLAASSYLYYLLDPPVGTFQLIATLVIGTSIGVCVAKDFVADGTISAVTVTAGHRAINAGPTSQAIAGSGGLVVDMIASTGSSTVGEWVKGAAQTLVGQADNGETGGANSSGAMSFATGVTTMDWSWTTYKAFSQSALVLTSAVVADTTIPTMTGTVTSSGVTSTGFTIDWAGTTRSDNVAITGYETSPDGGTTWIDRGNVTTAAFTGLSPSTSYTRLVRAYDAAGNKSTPALSITVVTSAPSGDTTVPVLAGSITQGTVTSTSCQISWPAGTDNVAVTSYEVSKDNGATWTDVGNVLTYTFTGLSVSTTYTQKVRAKDASGNVSTPALSLAVTTLSGSAGAFTSKPMVNDTDTVFASQAGWSVRINNATTGDRIATKTGLTTSSTGVLTYSDAGCATGTNYEHIYIAPNGDKGMQDLVAA